MDEGEGIVLKCWKGLVATWLVANMTCLIFERGPKVTLTAPSHLKRLKLRPPADFRFRILNFGFFSDTLVAVTAASEEAQTQVTRRAPR